MENTKINSSLNSMANQLFIPSSNGEGLTAHPAKQMLQRLRLKNLLLLLFIEISLVSVAQGVPLNIGNKVPDVRIGYNINKPSQTTTLYKNKASLILLNFFSSGCGSCIKDLNHLEALQAQFGSRIRIINITKEDAEKVKKNFARHKWSFPGSSLWKGDSNLLKLFPYEAIPHHVWLDSNFRIHYITKGENATAQNVSKFLAGEKMDLVIKTDLPGFDPYQPLWLEGGGRLYNGLQYYSFIMKRIEGYESSLIGRIYDEKTAGFRAINIPLLQLIKAAWSEYPLETYSNNNRVSLEVKETLPFITPVDINDRARWMQKNAYCYRLSLPLAKKPELFSIMQQDILRFFNYDISIEKRKKLCWVLVRTSNVDKLKSAGFVKRKTNPALDSIILNHSTLDVFVASLNNMNNLPMPFINETGYTGNVNLQLGAWYTEVDKLRSELHRYDLDLIQEEREIDMLVIRDKKEGSR